MAVIQEAWIQGVSTRKVDDLVQAMGCSLISKIGIFPNAASIRRIGGAVLLEQNDEWQLQHRYDA